MATHADIDAALAKFSFYRLEPNAPLVTSGTATTLASAAGVALPDDYAYFCSRYGAGAFRTPAYLSLPAGCALGPAFRVDTLYAIGANDDDWNPLPLLADMYEDRLPSDCLPVGTDPGGNLLLLGTKARSGVYAWDHEHGELAQGEIEQRADDLQRAGVDAQQLDIDQIARVWEEMFPARVTNPTGHGNLYRVADTFAAACAALRDRM